MIIISTDRGYQVYDSVTFMSLSQKEDNKDVIGSISKASMFHKSQLICFLGSIKNKVFRPNQLIIWNDYLNQKEASIKLYDTILTFSLLTYAICIFVPFRLLLFNVANLDFVLKLEDFPIEARLIDFNDTNPFMIANCSNLNKKTIKLSFFSIKDKKIFAKREMQLKTELNDIYNISFGQSSYLLIISFKNEGRIHIFNTDTYRLKYCINLQLSSQSNITNYCFDPKEKYFMFTINYKEVKIYKMYGKKNSYSYKCQCNENDYKQLENKKKNNPFNTFFNKMFQDCPNEFANHKFQHGGFCRLFMNPLSDSVISLIFQNGYANQLQLNRKKKNCITLLKEFVWLN